MKLTTFSKKKENARVEKSFSLKEDVLERLVACFDILAEFLTFLFEIQSDKYKKKKKSKWLRA